MKVWPMYRIREVDAHDDEIADTLADLHRLTFFDGAAIPEFDWGHWWLAYLERMPVAFAGVVPSTRAYNAGYFFPCRRPEEASREWASIALDARAGITCKAQWMELRRLGYHRQSRLRQQLHPGRLSAIPAAISMGLAQYAVLAQVYPVTQPDRARRACVSRDCQR